MRLRITFSKTDAMRYTGNLDLHRTWERAFRRANLPLAYSQGFHPQPRINLACALPLGFTSDGEVADIWLENDIPLQEIHSALEPALPPGLFIHSIEEVDNQAPSLQAQVRSSEYMVILIENISGLDQRLAELLAAKNLPRQRRDKAYDLRPLIEDIRRMPDDAKGHARLIMRLSAQNSATGRPDEVLAAMDIPPEVARIHRTHLFFT